MSALLFGYGGFALLCLAMERHFDQLFQRRPAATEARLLRLGGWLLLAASLWLAVARWGAGIGTVAWIGLLTPAALLVVLLLAYAARLCALLAVAAALGGLALAGS